MKSKCQKERENLHHMHIFHTDGQTDGQKGEEHFPLTVVMSVMFT